MIGKERRRLNLLILQKKEPKSLVDVIRRNRLPKRGIGMEFEASKLLEGESEVEITDKYVETEVGFLES